MASLLCNFLSGAGQLANRLLFQPANLSSRSAQVRAPASRRTGTMRSSLSTQSLAASRECVFLALFLSPCELHVQIFSHDEGFRSVRLMPSQQEVTQNVFLQKGVRSRHLSSPHPLYSNPKRSFLLEEFHLLSFPGMAEVQNVNSPVSLWNSPLS